MFAKPSRHAALQALEDFMPQAKFYTKERNFDRGPDNRENVSQLSPYLRHRLLTEKEVWQKTLEHHSFETVEKFLQEVVWRTYWKGWLERRPLVWDEWVDAVGRSEDSKELEKAREGKTGIGAFDTWARELVATNYLHNHARMWFASIWIFTLRLPWEAGAAFFLEHLLDGDPASNTLGWRWVAGLQTRGKHYVARAENIRRYTEGRLDPQGQLDEEAEPLAAGDPPEKIEAELPPTVASDPPRSGDGLFLTTDDLAPETLFESGAFDSVAGGRPEIESLSPLREARAVRDFRAAVVRSALSHTEDRNGKSGEWMDQTSGRAVVEWAETTRLKRVWFAHAPVGSTRRPLKQIAEALEASGIEVRRYARQWDHDLHPFAKSGFFAFRKKAFPLLKVS